MLYDAVLDLTAPSQPANSKAARELQKTIKYLISEDASNYRYVWWVSWKKCDSPYNIMCWMLQGRHTHTHTHTHAHTHTRTHTHAL